MSLEMEEIAVDQMGSQASVEGAEIVPELGEALGRAELEPLAGDISAEQGITEIELGCVERPRKGDDFWASSMGLGSTCCGLGLGDTPLYCKNKTIRAIREEYFRG